MSGAGFSRFSPVIVKVAGGVGFESQASHEIV